MSSPEVHEIVEKWLKESEYDGLVDADNECACIVGDISPCGEMREDCRAGYKYDAPDGWVVSPIKLKDGGAGQ